MANLSDLRFAHSDGRLDICADICTGKVLTCGVDGDVRIWEDFETDDPTSLTVGESMTAICAYDNKAFVADEDGSISKISLPNDTNKELVVKFSLAVNHLEISNDGKIVVGCSSDFSMKAVDLETKMQTTFGTSCSQTHPILSISIDPLKEYVAAASCSGSVDFWRFSEPSKPSHSLKVLPRFNDIAPNRSLSRLHFKPMDGKLLAIPVHTTVNLYFRDNWQLKAKLQPTNDLTDHHFSVCRFSDCGQYLAASTLNGNVFVWNISNGEMMLSTVHPKKCCVCALLWHPIYKTRLIFGDINGSVGVIKDFISSVDRSSSLHQEKHRKVMDEDLELTPSDKNLDVDHDRRSLNGSMIDGDASCDSNIGAIKAHFNKQIMNQDDYDLETYIDNYDNDFSKDFKIKRHKPSSNDKKFIAWTPKPCQSPFIVNSTPSAFKERFLKWNTVGIIRCYESNESSNIDVEFHDVTLHHAMQLSNSINNYSMADLNEYAIALASQRTNDRSARLQVVHYGGWDMSREWTCDLPFNQNPCCIAMGNEFLAVGSSAGYIWIFTIAGLQLSNFHVSSNLITMAAGSNDLAVCFADGFDHEGNNTYSLQIINNVFDCYNANVSTKRIPIKPGSEILWLGFSSFGKPCFCDSDGFLHILSTVGWLEIFNCNMENSNFFWPVSVNETLRNVKGIRLPKSSNKIPSFDSRHVLSIVNWKLNICDGHTEKGALESTLILSRLISNAESKDERSTNEEQLQAILKLFLLACNSERDCRAYDIACLADNAATLNALINIANKKGRNVLSDKITALASRRICQENDDNLSKKNAKNDNTDTNVESLKSCDHFVKTQQLFDDNDDLENFNFIEKNVSTDETNDFSFLNQKIVQRKSNIQTAVNTPNPFKKQVQGDIPATVDDASGSCNSIFDTIMNSVTKKRSSITNGSDESGLSKKPRMIKVKRQVKLSFESEKDNVSLNAMD